MRMLSLWIGLIFWYDAFASSKERLRAKNNASSVQCAAARGLGTCPADVGRCRAGGGETIACDIQ